MKIRNRRTGEIRDVPNEELPYYGIRLPQNKLPLQPAPLANEPMDIRSTSVGGKILSQVGRITQAFGNFNPALYRGINKSMRNTGVDIGVPEGTEVRLPPGQWKVVEAGGGWNRGYGNSLLVQNEQTGEKLRFSHLSKMANVKSGQKVQGGSRVALTGRTGHTTGAHLDLEYYDQLNRLANVLSSSYGKYL